MERCKKEICLAGTWHFFNDLDLKRFAHRFEGGEQNDANVHADSGVFYIIKIPLQALINRSCAGSWTSEPIDLCKAGNTWFNEVAIVISWKNLGESLRVFKHVWPRPNNRHVAEYNVDKLRKLIKVGHAQEFTHARDTRIIEGGLQVVGGLIYLHCPQFKAVKSFAFIAGALLPEKNRAPGVNLDKDCQDWHQPRQYQDSD